MADPSRQRSQMRGTFPAVLASKHTLSGRTYPSALNAGGLAVLAMFRRVAGRQFPRSAFRVRLPTIPALIDSFPFGVVPQRPEPL